MARRGPPFRRCGPFPFSLRECQAACRELLGELGTGRDPLSAMGVLFEGSPDAQISLGFSTLAVGGPLQMAGAALLASGRKTCWPWASSSCMRRLCMAATGGLLYWLESERLRPPSEDPVGLTACGQVTLDSPVWPQAALVSFQD